MKVLFSLKGLDDEVIVSCEDVPVDGPKIITGRVFTMLGKLHPTAAGTTLSRPGLSALVETTRDDLQTLDLFEERGFDEETGGGGHGWVWREGNLTFNLAS
jgi:hypothetical protein